MKYLCLIISISALFYAPTTSLDAICSYEHYRWLVVGQIYFCKVLNRLNIQSPDQAVIKDAEGTHTTSKSNDDVHGFYALNKSIEYFPRGIEKIFKNLKLINIQHGRIKELHLADMKPHTKLEYLALWENDIEVIEDGLFDFNPELTYVYFEKNKIFDINPKVFNNLPKLAFLDVQSNLCIDMYAKNNSAALVDVINAVKSQCTSTATKNLFNQVKIVHKMSTVALTKAASHEFGIKMCQNSVLVLNQRTLNLEKVAKVLLTNRNIEGTTKAPELDGKLLLIEHGMKNLELTLAVSKIEQSGNIKALNDKTADLESKLEKLQNSIKALNIEALQTQVDNIEKAIKAQEAETATKFENLEKSLKNHEDNLNSFKVEILTVTDQIVKKLENFEKKASEKLNEMSESFKASQNKAYADMSDKIRNFENELTNMQSRMTESIKIIDESCDVE